MKLHENKVAFQEVIEATASFFHLNAQQIEKDYYVSLLLEAISIKGQGIFVFKGGTSLSKCYGVINRFSEDIDLAIIHNSEHGATTSRRKNAKKVIIESISEVKMILINEDSIRSRRDFNMYRIAYESIYPAAATNDGNILIETIATYNPYPNAVAQVDSLIGKFLIIEEETKIINDYSINAFAMTIQSLERTFIDKVFALCDYYLKNDLTRHSRHLYDIHMLWTSKRMNITIIGEIMNAVIKDRQVNLAQNVSCVPGTNFKNIVEEVIDSDIYLKDFKEITKPLLYKPNNYDECIISLKEIFNSRIFPETITAS